MGENICFQPPRQMISFIFFFSFHISHQQSPTTNRMEPLIKLNNKNNLFDCPIHKTTAELLNGNQQQHNSQQNSVYYLSSYRSHQQQQPQQQQNAKKQQARDKSGFSQILDAEHYQKSLRRSQLLIL